MKIGTLVRQKIPHHNIYRYGLITINKSKQQILPEYVSVLWNPNKKYLVSPNLYEDYVDKKSLEIIAEPVPSS